jgi:DNA repair ATPase RecN
MSKTIEVPDIAQWEETDSELAKYTIQQLLKTYDDLEEQYKSLMKQIIEQNKRIDKAIEYINNYMPNYDFDHYNLEKLLNILKGEDIKEIPQFEGTLEQLDKLSIRGKDNESN